ncbi:MAG: hypothetical protein ACXWU1_00315 [Allosphingosinicella sp.]
MNFFGSWISALALLAPAPALGQTASPPPILNSDFSRLWTSWDGVNRTAMAREAEAGLQLQRDLATADAARMQVLRSQGRDLGEQVGEVVRGGDCAEGERLARAAGDFALVAAVREHCRAAGLAADRP